MSTSTIIKAFLMIVGFIFMCKYLIQGLSGNDANGTEKAVKVLLGTIGIVLVFSAIEFLILAYLL